MKIHQLKIPINFSLFSFCHFNSAHFAFIVAIYSAFSSLSLSASLSFALIHNHLWVSHHNKFAYFLATLINIMLYSVWKDGGEEELHHHHHPFSFWPPSSRNKSRVQKRARKSRAFNKIINIQRHWRDGSEWINGSIEAWVKKATNKRHIIPTLAFYVINFLNWCFFHSITLSNEK